jgi:signal transduction histidine kinase
MAMQKTEFHLFQKCLICWFVIVFTGVTHLANAQYEKAYQQADSLIELSKKLRYDFPDSAGVLGRRALFLSKQSGYELGEAMAYSNIGFIKYLSSQYDSSLEYLDKASIILEKLGERQKECTILNNIGAIATNAGDLEMAMISLTKALSIAHEISFDDEIPKIQNNIGRVYLERIYLGEPTHQKAIEHFETSYRLSKNDQNKINSCVNLGIAYQENNQHDMALQMFIKVLEHSQSANDEESYAQGLGLIGSHYLQIGEYNKALLYSLQELKIRENHSWQDVYLISTYNRLGQTHNKLVQFDSAIFYHIKALHIAQKSNTTMLYNTYEYIAKAYQSAGKYALALEYYQKYTVMKDSLIALENDQQIDELQTRYETATKDREITLLQNTRKLQTVIIAGGILTLIIAMGFIVVYKQKLHQQKQLAVKTEEINRQKIIDLLQEQEVNEIKAAISGQEKERKRIAGELHDSVAGTLAGIKQNLVLLAERLSLQSELQSLIRITDDVYDEVRGLSHHLVPPHVAATFFTQLLKIYSRDFESNHHIEVKCIVHPENEINDLPKEVKVELYRIVQELTTNVAKHAQAKCVEIQMTRISDTINLIVEDNGKGFDRSKAKEGIGLHNIKARVKGLQGAMTIDSSPKRGTIIIVDIPIGKQAQVSDIQMANISA